MYSKEKGSFMPMYVGYEPKKSPHGGPSESFWARNPEAIALLEKIAKQKIECMYCKELANGLNSLGQPVCGIPGNHSKEDDIVE
jgi:hypothetical protein